MRDSSTSSLADLVERITAWGIGMPVRAMEQVLAIGETAVPALGEALGRWRDDESRDLLWPVVLLGELRQPAGIEALVDQMRRTGEEALALAAAEALAKIGPPALVPLRELATAADPLLRLYAYSTLGWISDDRAYSMLIEALPRDRDMGDVLAMALGDQGRPEAVPLLYEAYQSCEPWQRIEFENVLQELHWGRSPKPLLTVDWRFRYRRLPSLGTFQLGWAGVSAIVRKNLHRMEDRVTIALRPLEEILKDPPEPEEPPEICEKCRAPIERPTGLPICPENALTVALHQLTFVSETGGNGLEDLFDLLDEIETDQWELYDHKDQERERWRDQRDELSLHYQTCRWLIEQGAEHVSEATTLLLSQAASLAARYGDPDGLLRPAARPIARGPKVGRNDSCPCGSGRKYKRCCLGKAQGRYK